MKIDTELKLNYSTKIESADFGGKFIEFKLKKVKIGPIWDHFMKEPNEFTIFHQISVQNSQKNIEILFERTREDPHLNQNCDLNDTLAGLWAMCCQFQSQFEY